MLPPSRCLCCFALGSPNAACGYSELFRFTFLFCAIRNSLRSGVGIPPTATTIVHEVRGVYPPPRRNNFSSRSGGAPVAATIRWVSPPRTQQQYGNSGQVGCTPRRNNGISGGVYPPHARPWTWVQQIKGPRVQRPKGPNVQGILDSDTLTRPHKCPSI